MRYPLREWGLTREDCGRIIAGAGLPLPPKSACFFCPAARDGEIEELRRTEPDYYRLALEMERRYRAGRHFRGDNRYTVKGRHRQTGEVEVLEVEAASEAEARALFRRAHADEARPHRYKVRASSAVVGLGRDFAWHRRIGLPLAAGSEQGGDVCQLAS